MSEIVRVGEILYGDFACDAIHVAIAPVTSAGGYLRPGMKLKFLHPDDTTQVVEAKKGEEWVGVVDPYLFPEDSWKHIEVGQQFWMFLKPGSVTSLTHVWTHPAYTKAEQTPPPTDPTAKAEKAIRQFLAGIDGPSYDEFIETANADGKKYLSYTGEVEEDDDMYGGDYGAMYMSGDCFVTIGTDSHGEIPAYIWDCVETVIGKKLDNRPLYFSCSC